MPIDVHDDGAVAPRRSAALPARKSRRARRAAKRANAADRRFLRYGVQLLVARRRASAIIVASTLGLATAATGFSA